MDGGEGEPASETPRRARRSAAAPAAPPAEAPSGEEPAAAAGAEEGEPELEGAAEPDGGEPESPEATEYAFGGEKFRDQGHAERVFRGLRSQLKAVQKDLSEVRAYATQAVQTVQAYQQHYGVNGTAQPPNGRQGAQAEPQPEADDRPFFERDDDQTLDFARELYDEGKGFDVALIPILRKLHEHYENSLKRALDRYHSERVEPWRKEAEVQQVFNTSMETFRTVAEEKGPDGKFLYPELRAKNPQIARDIVLLWREIDVDLKGGKRAIRHAVADYRSGYRAGNRQVDPSEVPSIELQGDDEVDPAPAGGAPSAGVRRSHAAREAARSTVVTGGGAPRPATGAELDPARPRTFRHGYPTVKTADGFDMGFTD